MMATRICLVGHRQLFMAGLAKILDEHPFEIAVEVEALGQARDVPDAIELIVVDKPDSIADIESDLQIIKSRTDGPRVVVIADSFDESEMVLAFAAGVDGYLLANISPEALRESLNLVRLGEYVFPSKLVTTLCNRSWGSRVAAPAIPADAALSEREAEIVARLAEGMPNKVIASELTITEATVKVHLKSILKKLGVTNRTQAAVWAINNGLTTSPQVAAQ